MDEAIESGQNVDNTPLDGLFWIVRSVEAAYGGISTTKRSDGHVLAKRFAAIGMELEQTPDWTEEAADAAVA